MSRVSRAFAAATAWMPKGWGDAGRQLAILVGVDVIYELGRGIADGSKPTAIRHGAQVISFERSTPLALRAGPAEVLPARPLDDRSRQLPLPERPVLDRHRLPRLALPLPQRVLLLRPQHVRGRDVPGADRLRRLPDRAAAPVPQDGFIDTVTKYSSVNSDSSLAKVFINPYAAVPSMHCAFALMIGGQRRRGLSPLVGEAWWAFWPILIAWVVIVTANHYWVDWALGWLVALAQLRDRQRRPGALETGSVGLAPARRRRRGRRGRGEVEAPRAGRRGASGTSSLISRWHRRRLPGHPAADATAAPPRPATARNCARTPAIA